MGGKLRNMFLLTLRRFLYILNGRPRAPGGLAQACTEKDQSCDAQPGYTWQVHNRKKGIF